MPDLLDMELDVDTLRCDLLASTNEALGLADEIALMVDTSGSRAELERLLANYRQVRNRMRTLRIQIRVEEGCR